MLEKWWKLKSLAVLILVPSLLISVNTIAQEEGEQPKVDPSEKAFEEQFMNQATGIAYDSLYVDKKLKQRPQKLTAFGYYRLFVYQRTLTEPYPGLEPFRRSLSVGDGYREPMLSLNVLARPNSKSSFGSELFFFTPYLGDTTGNQFLTNLGLNFYGNFRTEHGNFGIRAGGIHWYNLSPMTIGVFQILDRFSIFDRTPWEGVSNTGKYDDYYALGQTSPGDLRWSNQAFQGIILNGGKLPGDFAFDLFWGKTQQNGGLSGGINDPFASIPPTLDQGNVPTYQGFAGQDRTQPSIIQGGKLAKTFGKKNQTISYNGIYSRTSIDSTRTDRNRAYEVHTIGLDLDIAGIGISGELGGGAYSSPTYEKTWGEALMLRFRLPERYTFLPLDVQLYRSGKH